MSAEERREIKMDVETLPGKKVDVSVEDNSKVSSRDIYMRLCACRDFEIKLQWERAVFLTAFLIACFAGYGSFLLSVHQYGCGIGNFSPFVIHGIFITLTFVGVVLSMLWILMAKGSKAWYEHYEQAIVAFARTYATAGVPEYMVAHRWYDMPGIARNAMSNNMFSFKGGAYSVSKVVIAIGICSLMIWGVLFSVHCGIAIFNPISEWHINNVCLIISIIVLSILIVVQLKEKLGSGYLKIVEKFLKEPPVLHIEECVQFSNCASLSKAKAWIMKNKRKPQKWYLFVGRDQIICLDDNGNEKPIAELSSRGKDMSVAAMKSPYMESHWKLYSFDA